MTSSNTFARHRSASSTSRLSAISSAFAGNAGTIGRQAAVIAAASGLVLSSAMAANAAEAPVERDSAPASIDVKDQLSAPVSADSTVQVKFERPAVVSTPAPVVEQPKPVAAVPAIAPQVAAAPKATVTVQAAATAPAPAAAPAAGGANATLLSAAYSQVGITQDCTAMVEKALGAAGIPVGNIGPAAFLKYGKVVATPQPGDIIVQSGHVAIYAGNGQAVSGGMNGINATMAHPLSWLTATGGVTFVRVGA
jgi:cell wall-associated NlpC family hydrolase